jgi:hypothetical protein
MKCSIFFKSNYRIVVCYKGILSPRCKYPREQITTRIRTPVVNYINDEEEIIKSIIYPKELYYSTVVPDDPIENDIIDLTYRYPDWYKIEIKLLK